MKSVLLLFLLSISCYLFAQDQGIVFEHGRSWSEIKQRAKAENKYIFVDAFTTTCGPCKVMARDIFPRPEVGKFFNEHFINVKAQLDTTANDSEEIKNFYADAHELKTGYEINAFPTYIFFSPEGEPVHRSTGSSSAEVFVNVGRNALDPGKQYYALKKQYLDGKRDSAFLRKMVRAAEDAYEREFFESVAKQFLEAQDNLFTRYNLELLSVITSKITDEGFSVFRNQPDKVDAVIGKERREAFVSEVILRDVVYPAMYPTGQMSEKAEFGAAEKKVNKQFPDLSKQLILQAKAKHYLRYSKWNEFSAAVNEYVRLFGSKASAGELNNFAWAVFQHCEDVKCLESALSWSRKSLEGHNENNPTFIDTNANLLYKLGRKDEAIAMQQKAVTNSGTAGAEYRDTLEKMQNGEQTW